LTRSERVLLADDQPDVVEALRLLLKGEGYAVGIARSAEAVLEEVEGGGYDLLLMDLNYSRDTTSGREGLELLGQVRERAPDLPVVVMTAWASLELAVEAMRRGARDFLEKPWDNHRLLSIVRTQITLGRALEQGQRLEAAHRALAGDRQDSFIATAPAMGPVLELIERVGPSEANVLITGENGTGKGVVARALHRLSTRAERPLLTVNTGAVPETLFESELFGHVRGAFTDAKADRVGRFEMADGGTLFLDEIANITPRQQVGSSRTQRVDVRVLSATNADLAREVDLGRFRQDLLFRLRTVEIPLPRLAARVEDIPLLAAHFLVRHARRYRKELAGFEPQALAALERHSWPGNVRELDHAIERAVLMARGTRVTAADLGIAPPSGEPRELDALPLEDAERLLIRKALERHDGNVSHAAQQLGLSRSALYRRLVKFGLDR
jgi:DNA-binding NtrC family response regulator